MLGYGHSGTGHHERSGGRYVERADLPTPSAAGIHQEIGITRIHCDHGAAEGQYGASHLVGRLTLCPQPHQERGGLNWSRFSPHDHAEGRRRGLPAERCAQGELLDGGTQWGVEGHWYQDQANGSGTGEKIVPGQSRFCQS